MRSFVGGLAGLLAFIISEIAAALQSMAPKAASADPLVALILSENHALGPMPVTGGQTFSVSPATATLVAALIRKYAKAFGVPISLVTSLIRGESDFSPAAIDPNDQLDTPGETAAQKAEHADLGIEQEDVSTAEGDASFKGMTLAQIEAKLVDPDYGVRYVCATLAGNLTWARAQFAADSSLETKVPNGDPDVLACQAYNSGPTGALHLAHTSGLTGNWSYGLGVLSRAAAMRTLDT